MDGDRASASAGHGPRISLRLRLTIWVVAIFCMIQWVSGGIFWLYQRAAMDRVLDAALEDRGLAIAEDVAPLLPEIDDFELLGVTRPLRRNVELGEFYLDVVDESGASVLVDTPGRLPLGSLPIAAVLEADAPVLVAVELGPGPGAGGGDAMGRARAVLVGTNDNLGNRYVVVLTGSDVFAQSQLALLSRVLILAAVVGPIAAGVSGWFIAGIAVAPLERVRDAAAHFGPESMGTRIELKATNTEVADLAAELEDARQRIDQAFAAQERFISNVSHEVKTPISVMLVEAEAVPLEGAPEGVADFVESVKEEMTRLGSLVESFLTLARVRDGRDPVHDRAYAVNDLIMDTVDRCLLMGEHHGVRLAPRLLDGDGGMGVTVRGDPELLCTMLDNLVRNAIRFSPEGGLVAIEPAAGDSDIRVRVIDEGPGIPPERLDTIFDRFSHTESGHRQGRGHGLGLAIALGVAELHGGSITPSNLEPTGCCFEVRLPRGG